jgi:signal transduction histidine kinase
MISSMTTANEDERLLELYHYNLLDTEAEEDFNEIVQLASQICNVPISMISLIDSHRQWFKARVGLKDPQTPRDISFCAHAIAGNEELFIVEDASKDERFHDYPNVTGDPNIRFYAGVPLITSRGNKLGTLCVINSTPQQLTKEQKFALKVLAKQVVKLADQKLQNRYLLNYKRRLDQQVNLQTKILTIVAHDVRSPLVSLQGIIELTEENAITDEQRQQMLQMWQKQLDNTMGLLSNLVDWGKLNAANEIKGQSYIDLKELVDHIFESCRSTAEAKGNKLHNKLKDKFLALADVNVLKFIIRNLFTNAIKFTENGTISVNAQRKKNKVKFSITDTGVGMNAQQLSALQEGRATMIARGTRNETGSGLGLMLVRDFVEILDGQINIESLQGKGTTIQLEVDA